jgi:hypothetical protein
VYLAVRKVRPCGHSHGLSIRKTVYVRGGKNARVVNSTAFMRSPSVSLILIAPLHRYIVALCRFVKSFPFTMRQRRGDMLPYNTNQTKSFIFQL